MEKKRIGKKATTSMEAKRKIAQEIGRISAVKHSGFDKYVQVMTDPRSASPTVFPAIVTGRAGAAKFPLTVNLQGRSDWTIIARPSLTQPLMVSSTAVVVEDKTPVAGYADFFAGDCLNAVNYGECTTLGTQISGRVALPLSSVLGTLFTARFSYESSKDVYYTHLWAWNGAVWADLGASVSGQGPGSTDDVSISVNWLPSYTHYSFSIVAAVGSSTKVTGDIGFKFSGIAGTLSCNANLVETALDTYEPDWARLKEASTSMVITGMDCLVTYEGSTLNNQGAIAVANVDKQLSVIGSTYDTVASYPFDKYRGRLASEGDTKGGAHWFFLPNNPEQLFLREPLDEDGDMPTGIFGITGMDANQPVRVEINVHVNFYSDDPSYAMKIRPPFEGFLYLLWQLRKEVPLVSSNDNHLKLIADGVKRALKTGASYGLENPERIVQALSMILTLL
jgi:hypothetical protein